MDSAPTYLAAIFPPRQNIFIPLSQSYGSSTLFTTIIKILIILLYCLCLDFYSNLLQEDKWKCAKRLDRSRIRAMGQAQKVTRTEKKLRKEGPSPRENISSPSISLAMQFGPLDFSYCWSCVLDLLSFPP